MMSYMQCGSGGPDDDYVMRLFAKRRIEVTRVQEVYKGVADGCRAKESGSSIEVEKDEKMKTGDAREWREVQR